MVLLLLLRTRTAPREIYTALNVSQQSLFSLFYPPEQRRNPDLYCCAPVRLYMGMVLLLSVPLYNSSASCLYQPLCTII